METGEVSPIGRLTPVELPPTAPIGRVYLDVRPKDVPEPPPFPIDAWSSAHLSDAPDEQKVDKREGLTNVFHTIAHPWMSEGYATMSALNRGLASFYDNLDTMARWFESQGMGKKEGFFDELSKISAEKADYWKERAEKVGITFLDEMIGEVLGGALPGVTDFSLKVASGFSIPAIIGVQRAKEHDTDPFIGGLVEAAKTKTLDSIFKLAGPFKRYIQSLVSGTVFGAQEAVEGPEGQKARGFAKGFGVGIGMSLMAPSGKWGIRDLYPEVGLTVPEIREQIEAFEKAKPLAEPITPIEAKKPEKPQTPKTVLEFINWDFPVPEGGSSKSPKTVFGWEKGEYETLHDVSQYKDQFRFNEILGKGWESEYKPSLHLKGKIKKDDLITVYRVSEEGNIIPGAYVSESLEYVKKHQEKILRGVGKIYSLEVKPSELMVYGDPHEFIYVPENPEIGFERFQKQLGEKPEIAPAQVKPRPVGKPIEKAPDILRWVVKQGGVKPTDPNIDLTMWSRKGRGPIGLVSKKARYGLDELADLLPEAGLPRMTVDELAETISSRIMGGKAPKGYTDAEISRLEAEWNQERMDIVESDPKIERPETRNALTASLDDEIMALKEEWRERGYSESEINTAVQEAYKIAEAQGVLKGPEEVRTTLEEPPEEVKPSIEEIRQDVQLLKDEAEHIKSITTKGSRVFVKLPESDFEELRQGIFGKITKPAKDVHDKVLVQHDLEGKQVERWYNPLNISPAKPTEIVEKFPEPSTVGAAQTGTIPGLFGPPEIVQISQALSNLPKETSLNDRLNFAPTVARVWKGTLSAPKNAFEKIKALGTASWDWYSRPPTWTTFDDMLGKYLGGRQVSGKEVADFSKEITNKLPKGKREAIVNWIQADGDMTLLQDRANKTTDPALKKGYETALNLTPDEITFAMNVHQYFNSMLDRAVDAGIVDHGVENYVNQLWEKKDNPVSQKLMAEINAGMLRQNPQFAKKRVFESYFDGEQAGFVPKNKDIGWLIGVYQQSFDEAIQARAFIKSMFDGKASDGRPLVAVRGGGSALPKGEEVPEAYLIRPRTTQEEVFDYKEIVHPALRKWKWTSKDQDGNPIFVQGDVIAHPEIYDHLKNVLSRSKVTENWVGKAAIRGSAELKATLLSLSLFHQVQIGVHAAFHWENPFGAKKIDFTDPIQRELVEHGLMVFNHNALAEFGEGLSTTGLPNKIPVLGTYFQQYGHYLFQDLIPRLKMKLAVDMVERNSARYPNLSRDQILKLSADQANAAFGELNYKQMGRNPTHQDLFRLAALAPDFLEARTRFVGQALSPYGREQAIALIRGATAMYAGAKIVEAIANQVDPDNNKIHWDRPFSITLDGKEYSLRSVPGDIQHLIKDPRSFIYHRLNPSVTKPMVESITGRDIFGKKRDIIQQVEDSVTGFVPIPGQGFFTKKDRTIWDSILSSMGVSSYKARTAAERKMLDIQSDLMGTGPMRKEKEERIRLRNELQEEFAKTGKMEAITEALKEGKIIPKDIEIIIDKTLKGPLERGIKSFEVPDALRVWKEASDEERMEIHPIILRKIMSWRAPQSEKDEYKKEIQEFMVWRSKGERKVRKLFPEKQ